VVEGVETEVIAKRIADMGAPCLQGFLYGRPVPLADFEAQVLAQATVEADPLSVAR